MARKNETVEARAVKISATIMQAAGLCRYDDVSKCRRVYPDDAACCACIEKWLLTKARRELKGHPAAEVAPVRHGMWIGEGDGYADGEIVMDVWYCSECDHCIDEGIDDEAVLPNYCPNCGAKMDGKEVEK